MNIDFQVVLTAILFIDILIVAVYKLFFKRRLNKIPFIVEQALSFLPVLLVIWVLRSFILEPYRIPSSSLEPSLLIGDLIVVNKFQYGIRSPISNHVLWHLKEPKQGDVVVFRVPFDNKTYYIKRIIGVPGDRVQYKDRKVFVNGFEAKQSFIDYAINSDHKAVSHYKEQLGAVEHDIYLRYARPEADYDVVVPDGHYFVMGDNRTDSADARYWGFVPFDNFIGQAFAVWMSWDGDQTTVRWHRIGKLIH